ncbi:hypothetical protein NSMS1_47260 [Nostoc sp. MS1]|nr:hypothetical protein NSMS1_47260 [Nostoc sp. MS1]
MVQVRYSEQNGERYELEISDNHIVVRTESRSALVGNRPFEVATVLPQSYNILNRFDNSNLFAQVGVEVFQAKEPSQDSAL